MKATGLTNGQCKVIGTFSYGGPFQGQGSHPNQRDHLRNRIQTGGVSRAQLRGNEKEFKQQPNRQQ